MVVFIFTYKLYSSDFCNELKISLSAFSCFVSMLWSYLICSKNVVWVGIRSIELRYEACSSRGTGPCNGFADDRQVSNIADGGYLGPIKTLATFSTLLKQPSQNPHATLITLFLNAIDEVSTSADRLANIIPETNRLQRYLPLNMQPVSQKHNHLYGAEFLAFSDARIMMGDFDKLFQRYVDKWKMEDLGKMLGMEMKGENTVVDKWPLRLKENATQEHFDLLRASAHQGLERYVEWRVAR